MSGVPVYRYYPPLPYTGGHHQLHRDHDNRMHKMCDTGYLLHDEIVITTRVSTLSRMWSQVIRSLCGGGGVYSTIQYYTPIPPPHQGHHLLQHNHDNRMHNLCDAGYRLHAEYDLDNRVSGSHQLCEVDWSQVIRSL